MKKLTNPIQAFEKNAVVSIHATSSPCQTVSTTLQNAVNVACPSRMKACLKSSQIPYSQPVPFSHHSLSVSHSIFAAWPMSPVASAAEMPSHASPASSASVPNFRLSQSIASPPLPVEYSR